MLISPKYEIQIDWSFSYINQPINSEWATIVSGDRKKVSLVDRNLSPKYEYQFPADAISRLAISPKGDLLAAIMANGNHLEILTAENQLVFEEQLPNPPVEVSSLYNANGFLDCWFDPDGLRFWCMKLIEMKEVEIQIRDTNSWQIQRKLRLKDHMDSRCFSFHPHPENQILAVWAASGQNGQQIYWLYDDGIKIHAVEVACLYDTAPPEFHPAGGEFVVNDCERKISRFSFPDCNLLGICEWSWPDSDDGFGYYMCYLSDDRILVNTDQGRMHIIDINKMEISDELILIGHEPRSCNELYPNLKDFEEGICGDLDYFYRFDSDRILSVHSQLPSQEPRSKQKTLVIFGGKELFGSLAKVQPSAPYSKLFIQSLGIS